MSRPQTHEQRLLYKADQYLSCLAHTHEERLEILEAVAASKSHCDIIEYWKAFDFSCVNVDASVVNNLLQYIEESGIPVSMARCNDSCGTSGFWVDKGKRRHLCFFGQSMFWY